MENYIRALMEAQKAMATFDAVNTEEKQYSKEYYAALYAKDEAVEEAESYFTRMVEEKMDEIRLKNIRNRQYDER